MSNAPVFTAQITLSENGAFEGEAIAVNLIQAGSKLRLVGAITTRGRGVRQVDVRAYFVKRLQTKMSTQS